MKISKMNKTKRQGVSVVNILAGLALLAITAAVVGPRFVDAKKPGYISNLKSEIVKIENYITDYAVKNDGSYGSISFTSLKTDNVIEGADATAIDASGIYKPRWASDDIEITLSPSGSDVLVTVDIVANTSINADWEGEFETEIEKYVKNKWGAEMFDGTTSTKGTFAETVSNTNGTFQFKVQ